MSKIQIALIGAGNFARWQHLPNLARIPECQLRCVCDIDGEVADTAAKRYGAPLSTTDYPSALRDSEVDAVVIAVRDDLQAGIAIAALDAGKHVYVEKPLATRPEACREVAEAQQNSGRRLAVGFNRRFAPIYVRARDVIAGDGGPFNLHMRMADEAAVQSQKTGQAVILQT